MGLPRHHHQFISWVLVLDHNVLLVKPNTLFASRLKLGSPRGSLALVVPNNLVSGVHATCRSHWSFFSSHRVSLKTQPGFVTRRNATSNLRHLALIPRCRTVLGLSAVDLLPAPRHRLRLCPPLCNFSASELMFCFTRFPILYCVFDVPFSYGR